MDKYLNRLVEERKCGKLSRREFLSLATGVVGAAAASTLLAACGEAATATPVPTEIPTATAVPPTPTPTGPTVGGTIVRAMTNDIPTLDPHKTNGDYDFLGASLVSLGPDGQYVPYLAESWNISDDSLTWEFKLKDGVKFHDGTPLTADDFAWTFARAKEIGGVAASFLSVVEEAVAADESTLVLKLGEPFMPFMFNLTYEAILQPLPRALVEEQGDEFFNQPIGVGPYKFKERRPGESLVLERNPDFKWAPSFAKNPGPCYIQTVESRVIPEYATQVAGLEAGEIDDVILQVKDVERLRDTGKFEISETVLAGFWPAFFMNLSLPLFSDIRVRQAFNLAVDREALIKVVAQGQALPLYGPMSQTVIGYWPGVEQIGYKFDLDRAKALMEDAGYTVGSSGMLEKDGEPLKIIVKVSQFEEFVKLAEVLKEQFKALGVDLEIQLLEEGQHFSDMVGGNYELGIGRIQYDEGDLLFLLYHSSSMGATNIPQLQDAEMDQLLETTRSASSLEERQEALDAAQKYAVENALAIPLYAAKLFRATSKRLKNAMFMPGSLRMYLYDAYIET